MTFLKKSIWVLLLMVSIAACDNTTDTNNTNETGTTTTRNDGEAIDLVLNLETGTRFTQEMTVDYNITINMGEEREAMEQNMVMGMTFVNEVLASGDSLKLQMMLDNMTMTMDMMGMQVKIDTDTPDNSNPMAKQMNDIFGAMTDKPLVATYTSKAQQVSLTGFDKMLEDMAKDKGVSQEQIEQMTQNMQGNFGTSYGAILPEQPVAVGDSWENESTVNAQGMNMTTKNRYTLESIEGDTAFIKIESDIMLTEDAIKDMGLSPDDVSMTGTQSGMLHVNINTGWTDNTTMQQNMKMTMNMMGMEMETTTEGTIIMKTVY